MSGMDRLTDEALERIEAYGYDTISVMARELLAHRRASQAAPAPDDQFVTTLPKEAFDAFAKACDEAPAPSDGLREENERLRAHIQTMQGYVREYLEPIPYNAKHATGTWEGWTYNEPDQGQSEQQSEYMRNRMAQAVLNDLIHMLDGPEERAALSASPAQEGDRQRMATAAQDAYRHKPYGGDND